MNLQVEVINLLANLLGIDEKEIPADKPLSESIAIDSTEMVDLILALEKKYKIKFNIKLINKFSSPVDISNTIQKLLN